MYQNDSSNETAHSANDIVRSVAIVGSGVAGLTAGVLLKAQGHDVTLFEKSRGPGGRLSAKRVTGTSVDMGGQYFTARNPDFLPFLRQHAGGQTVAPWHGLLGYQQDNGDWSEFPAEPRYVGAPRMTAITRGLSDGLNVQAQTQVARLHPDSQAKKWHLQDSDGQNLGAFDQVIITAPPAQARDLLAHSSAAQLATELNTAVSQILPCWAVAVKFSTNPWPRFQGARVANSPLFWVADNTSKPGRESASDEPAAGHWWVLHATPEWTTAHVDDTPQQVVDALMAAFSELSGNTEPALESLTHRWLYARSEAGGEPQPGHLWFASEQLGLAGDWLSGGRIEGAYNSAVGLVDAIGESEQA